MVADLVGDDLADEGWALRRGVVPPPLLAAARVAFTRDVKPSRMPFLRQGTVRPEPHVLSATGLVTNPLLDVHASRDPALSALGAAILDLLGSDEVLDLTGRALGGEPILIQTMMFESSRGNAAHADGYFLGGPDLTDLVGIWIALEDIVEAAGRFFVHPRSHLLAHSAPPDVREAFARYEAGTLRLIRGEVEGGAAVREAIAARSALAGVLGACDLPAVHPALAAGDVVLWTGATIHGSARPHPGGPSRLSLTAHFLRADKPLLRQRRTPAPLRPIRSGALRVHR